MILARKLGMRGAEDAATFESMATTSVDPSSVDLTTPSFTLDPNLSSPTIALYQPGLGYGNLGSFVPTDTNAPSSTSSLSAWVIPGAFVLLIFLLAKAVKR